METKKNVFVKSDDIFRDAFHCLPWRCPERCCQGLWNACYEFVGIFPDGEEVDSRQHERPVDKKTDKDGDEVEADLPQQDTEVFHLHDFSGDKKGDTYRWVPCKIENKM